MLYGIDENLKNLLLLKCIYCNTNFSSTNRPLIKTCGHNICNECLCRNIIYIKCIFCEREYKTKEISSFSINFTLEDLLHKGKISKSTFTSTDKPLNSSTKLDFYDLFKKCLKCNMIFKDTSLHDEYVQVKDRKEFHYLVDYDIKNEKKEGIYLIDNKSTQEIHEYFNKIISIHKESIAESIDKYLLHSMNKELDRVLSIFESYHMKTRNEVESFLDIDYIMSDIRVSRLFRLLDISNFPTITSEKTNTTQYQDYLKKVIFSIETMNDIGAYNQREYPSNFISNIDISNDISNFIVNKSYIENYRYDYIPYVSYDSSLQCLHFLIPRLKKRVKLSISFISSHIKNINILDLIQSSFICCSGLDCVYLIKYMSHQSYRLNIYPCILEEESIESIVLSELVPRKTKYSYLSGIYYKYKLFIFGVSENDSNNMKIYKNSIELFLEVSQAWIDLSVNPSIQSFLWKRPVGIASKFSLFIIDSIWNYVIIEFSDEKDEYIFKYVCLKWENDYIHMKVNTKDLIPCQSDDFSYNIALKSLNIILNGTEYECELYLYTAYGVFLVNTYKKTISHIENPDTSRIKGVNKHNQIGKICKCLLTQYEDKRIKDSKWLLCEDSEGDYFSNGYYSNLNFVERGISENVIFDSYFLCLCEE